MRVRLFKPQFAPLVKSGVKRQTIRPMPKRMPKIGDHESWRQWTGRPYRSPQTELAQVEIIGVERIRIRETEDSFFFDLMDRPLRGALIPVSEWSKFAKADGFDSTFEMASWFRREHGLPFEGIVINAK